MLSYHFSYAVSPASVVGEVRSFLSRCLSLSGFGLGSIYNAYIFVSTGLNGVSDVCLNVVYNAPSDCADLLGDGFFFYFNKKNDMSFNELVNGVSVNLCNFYF